MYHHCGPHEKVAEQYVRWNTRHFYHEVDLVGSEGFEDTEVDHIEPQRVVIVFLGAELTVLTREQAVSQGVKVESPFSGLPEHDHLLSKALNENVTKFHISHSVQSTPTATTFSRDEKFKISPPVSAHPS